MTVLSEGKRHLPESLRSVFANVIGAVHRTGAVGHLFVVTCLKPVKKIFGVVGWRYVSS